MSSPRRRYPVGAELVADAASLRVWAPRSRSLTLVLPDGTAHRFAAEPDGYHALLAPGLRHGDCYWLRPDDGPQLPDPASRFQPKGPLGPSMVIDPLYFAWTDEAWRGIRRDAAVITEVHIGSFTPAGTWRAAIACLPRLAEVGITVIELMPVGEFPGAFGWGYDVVGLFAPYHHYGTPDDFRAFVDAAHGLGIGVILDVVFNHLGPGGDFLERFSPTYYSTRYLTDWGKALNFDGEGSGPVREWILANGRYWMGEFHLDGFRIDATQNIYDFDEGHEHILAAFARAARASAGARDLLIVGENEPQDCRLIRSRAQGGPGLEALWNDDFHHTARVALTGRNEAYLTDYRGTPQEFVSTAKRGFLYQGQRYRWQEQPRGTPTGGFGAASFIAFLQNHDQLANSGLGHRIHRVASPGRYRALTALLLLGPATPMLFQGQEFGASAPFLYFADYAGERADAVDAGRKAEVSQFPSLATEAMQARIPRPDDPETFRACKLDWAERDADGNHLALHRDLLRLHASDPVLVAARRTGALDGAVLGAEAFCLRFFGAGGDDRLLLVNLGTDLELAIMPEPLLAPPAGHDWALRWTSEDPAYAGSGAPAPRADRAWVLPGATALLMAPGPFTAERRSGLEKALDQAAKIRAAGD
jgi:maltooligosyltrehalose trehalohydrolase